MELVLFVVVLIAGIAAVAAAAGSARRPLGIGAAAVAIAGASLWRAPDATLAASTPAERTDGGFVGSVSCRSCHPGEHASWHASYHRTMTQRATPEAVLGDFDDVTLTDRGRTYRFEREGDAFFVTMPNPDWELDALREPARFAGQTPPSIRGRVVMTTGSHHFQTCWIRRPDQYRDAAGQLRPIPQGGMYLQVPWVWMVAEQRWIPSLDSFLAPHDPEPGRGITQWNQSCTGCHSVATAPELLDSPVASRSAELGIACEACHGPGEAHVRANLDPLRRYTRHWEGDGDPTIVNPARLEPARSAEVCGQCHSFHKERDLERWQQSGIAYRAGDVLADTKQVFRFTERPTDPLLLEHLRHEPDALQSNFWGDGTIRVAGREYNGLIESACATEGGMTCLSCHALHDYAGPADQLRADVSMDAACIECHGGYAEPAARLAHTHHAAGSSGDSCVECHMPHTTWGLFHAMRSHRVDSPSAAVTKATGRPNACNQCHVDRPLAWAAERLTDWYGQPPVEGLDDDDRTRSLVAVQALRGDAAQRAIAAWTLGWETAQRTGGAGWQRAILAELVDDPYAAIRKVAGDALARLPGGADLDLDFVAPPLERAARAQQLRGAADTAATGTADPAAARAVFRGADGRLDLDALRQQLSRRDNRRVRVIE